MVENPQMKHRSHLKTLVPDLDRIFSVISKPSSICEEIACFIGIVHFNSSLKEVQFRLFEIISR